MFSYSGQKPKGQGGNGLQFKMVPPTKLDRHKAANAVSTAKVIYKMQAAWKKQLPGLTKAVASRQRRCV